MKRKLRTLLPVLGMIVGLAVLGYYPLSEYLDAQKRARAAQTLTEEVQEADTSQVDALLEQAHAYNRALAGLEDWSDSILDYEDQLALNDPNGAFATLKIPKINLTMPVYKTAETSSLAMGAGHVKNSSLPIGGKSTHTVLSGHSGMPNMKAFDDLSKLEPGDIFGIEVLGTMYTYEVTSTEVVLPDQVDSLEIVQGEDLATLITCTPYGINSHRLLVHGKRTTVDDSYWEPTVIQTVTSAAKDMTSLRNAPFLIGMALFLVVLFVLLVRRKKRPRQG